MAATSQKYRSTLPQTLRRLAGRIERELNPRRVLPPEEQINIFSSFKDLKLRIEARRARLMAEAAEQQSQDQQKKSGLVTGESDENLTVFETRIAQEQRESEQERDGETGQGGEDEEKRRRGEGAPALRPRPRPRFR